MSHLRSAILTNTFCVYEDFQQLPLKLGLVPYTASQSGWE